VLACPRVLVLNKQRAEIQLGQRLGYFTTIQNLTSAIQQVQFLDTGTLLRFRPFVSTDGMIRMEVHPEKSTGQVVQNVPSSNTSEVTTNVMVPDGATIVIGGLIENTDTSSQQGTLGLSRLPVVGPLFRQKQQVSTKRELIVLLTPRIWNPGAITGLADPNFTPKGGGVQIGGRGTGGPLDRTGSANGPSLTPQPGAAAPAAPAAGTTPTAPDAARATAAAGGQGGKRTIPIASSSDRPYGSRRAADRHVVKRGENFWTISRSYYGSGRYYKALWSANRGQVEAPDRLVVEMEIVVPPVERLDSSLIVPLAAPPTRPIMVEAPRSDAELRRASVEVEEPSGDRVEAEQPRRDSALSRAEYTSGDSDNAPGRPAPVAGVAPATPPRPTSGWRPVHTPRPPASDPAP
jgi:Bacterial type II and III secretion system protein/LysM domain